MKQKKVGVIGLNNAGKTVFITSMISQLTNSYETIGKSFQDIDGYEPCENNTFCYEKFRENFSYNEWPDKTRDTTKFKAEFTYKRKKTKNRYTLELIDVPGERISDYSMLKHNNFDDWSKEMLNTLNVPRKVRRYFTQYIDCCTTENSGQSKIIYEYKKMLYRFMENFIMSSISPSTFKLDRTGNVINHSENLSSYLKERYVGNDVENQFAPLPESVIIQIEQTYKKKSKEDKKNDEIYKTLKQFRKRYKLYRKKVVIPFFKKTVRCNSLVILVDIPNILCSGGDFYNDMQCYIENLIKCLNPKKFSSRVWNKMQGKVASKISSIAFLAAKADIVLPNDRENLKALLIKLFKHKVSKFENLKKQYFLVSSLRSTEMVKNSPNQLKGKPKTTYAENNDLIETAQNDEKLLFSVSSLPNKWPDDDNWPTREYDFPDVFPIAPKRNDAPMQHIGMDKVFSFLINN